MTIPVKDEKLVKALTIYAVTIRELGWEAGEPLIARYSEAFLNFREMAWAVGIVLRSDEIRREEGGN